MNNKDDEDKYSVEQPDLDQTLNDLLYGYNKKSKPPETQAGPATLRGLGQGASLGFGDELAGGAEALYDKAKGSDQALSDLYTKHRDESRQANAAAQQAHPAAYGAGQLGGSLATSALLPGGVAGLAAQGAANAAGNSNASNIKDLAKDTAIGGAVGAGIGAGGVAFSKLKDYIKGVPTQAVANESGNVKNSMGLRDTVLDPNRDNGTIGVQDTMPAPKPELELRDNSREGTEIADNVARKKQDLADRIAAFRKRQGNDLDQQYKSDKVAQEMFGLTPGEKSYDPRIDDITVPQDKRQDFGALSGLPPGTPFTDQHRVLMGKLPIPKTPKVPIDLNDMYNGYAGKPITAGGSVKASAAAPPVPLSSQPMEETVNTLRDSINNHPDLLGKYAKPLAEAAQRGSTALASTHFLLYKNDPKYREIANKLRGL